MRALAPHYHVGIVVPDLTAARAEFSEQLGVTWGPVLDAGPGRVPRPGRPGHRSCPPPSATRWRSPASSSSRRCPGRCGSATSTPTCTTSVSGATTCPRTPPGWPASAARCSSAAGPGTRRPCPSPTTATNAASASRSWPPPCGRPWVLPLPARRILTEPGPCSRYESTDRTTSGWTRWPSPSPARADVVVRVAACGICGSDLSYIRMGGVAGPTGTPMCLGHEMAGVVEWVGSEVTRQPGG